jgi:hypothetical protein
MLSARVKREVQHTESRGSIPPSPRDVRPFSRSTPLRGEGPGVRGHQHASCGPLTPALSPAIASWDERQPLAGERGKDAPPSFDLRSRRLPSPRDVLSSSHSTPLRGEGPGVRGHQHASCGPLTPALSPAVESWDEREPLAGERGKESPPSFDLRSRRLPSPRDVLSSSHSTPLRAEGPGVRGHQHASCAPSPRPSPPQSRPRAKGNRSRRRGGKRRRQHRAAGRACGSVVVIRGVFCPGRGGGRSEVGGICPHNVGGRSPRTW